MRIETKKSFILVLGTGTTTVLSMLYSVYAGRVLGPADYADFIASISLVYFLSAVLGPISEAVARFSALFAGKKEYGKIRTLNRMVSRSVALYALAAAIIGVVLSKPIADMLNFNTVFPLLMSYGMVYLTLLINVPRNVLRGLQEFKHYNFSIVFEALFRILIGVMLLTLTCSVVSGLSAYLFALLIFVYISHQQILSALPKHKAEPIDTSSIIRFTIPMYILAMVHAGFQNLDMFFVKHYFSSSDAGNYGAAFALTRGIGLLAGPFGILLLPLITDLNQRGKKITRTIIRLCGYFLALVIAPLMVFWFWPVEIMMIYGPDFKHAAPLLWGLACARVLSHISNLLAITLAAMNEFRFLFFTVSLLVGEIIALMVYHRTFVEVITVVFISQGSVLIGMLIITLRYVARMKQRHIQK